MDDRCLTAAQFRSTRGGIQLRGLFCQPLATSDPGDDTALIDALKSVVSQGSFKGRRVAFNLPFHEVSVFPVHFQLGEQEDPEEAILREALKFLPYPLEEAVIDYPSLVRQSGICDATVVAVRRQALVRWLDILHRAGLTAEVMEFGFSSLLRLHRNLFPDDSQSCLVCHIGRTHSLLAALTGTGLFNLTEIPWGIQSLLEKLRNQLKLPGDVAEAVNLLKAYGLAHGKGENMPSPPGARQSLEDARKMYRVTFQVVAPAVDELVYEIHKTVGYLRSLHNLTILGKVYLYGLSGLILQLDSYLEKHTGIPTSNVDVLARLGYVDVTLPACIPEGISPVPALGLAMREITWF